VIAIPLLAFRKADATQASTKRGRAAGEASQPGGRLHGDSGDAPPPIASIAVSARLSLQFV